MLETRAIDQAAVEQFAARVVADAGATLSTVLAYAGDRLGLYRALAESGPAGPAGLAERTGTNERMVREWLANQAASGYLSYDPLEGTFALPPEHAPALARDDTPVAVGGLFQFVAAAFRDLDRLIEAFRSGRSLGWKDHHPELFDSVERYLRVAYRAHLVHEWIPALAGVEAKLRAGARVADIGCGHGAATIIMAKAYPESTFAGFDSHARSIDRARTAAAEEGVTTRIRFEVADAASFPGERYDLVCFFDALHDMGDPLGVARHAHRTLADDGTVLLIEPYAADRVEENLTPIGRLAYAASTIFCTPSALAQGGAALGAQAGEARLRAIFHEGGFTRFRRAAATPFTLVLEARP